MIESVGPEEVLGHVRRTAARAHSRQAAVSTMATLLWRRLDRKLRTMNTFVEEPGVPAQSLHASRLLPVTSDYFGPNSLAPSWPNLPIEQR